MANYNHANGLFRKGRLQEAVAHYRRALDARPQIEEARLNLANAPSRLGRFEEAAEEYEACLELNPQNGKTYFNLGKIRTFNSDSCTKRSSGIRMLAAV